MGPKWAYRMLETICTAREEDWQLALHCLARSFGLTRFAQSAMGATFTSFSNQRDQLLDRDMVESKLTFRINRRLSLNEPHAVFWISDFALKKHHYSFIPPGFVDLIPSHQLGFLTDLEGRKRFR